MCYFWNDFCDRLGEKLNMWGFFRTQKPSEEVRRALAQRTWNTHFSCNRNGWKQRLTMRFPRTRDSQKNPSLRLLSFCKNSENTLLRRPNALKNKSLMPFSEFNCEKYKNDWQSKWNLDNFTVCSRVGIRRIRWELHLVGIGIDLHLVGIRINLHVVGIWVDLHLVGIVTT